MLFASGQRFSQLFQAIGKPGEKRQNATNAVPGVFPGLAVSANNQVFFDGQAGEQPPSLGNYRNTVLNACHGSGVRDLFSIVNDFSAHYGYVPGNAHDG